MEHTMKKSDPPTTFGVFKPVGHTLMAFRSDDERLSAASILSSQGFGTDTMVHYTSAEMVAQVDDQLMVAGPLARFGYELDLIHAHKELALQGCSFLVVHAPSDTLAAQVAKVVRSVKPATAQHYGHFMIEDLTELAPGRVGVDDFFPETHSHY